MITVKIGEVVVSQEALNALMGQTMPAATALNVGRVVGAVPAEIEGYEKRRVALCEKYGKLSEDEKEFIFDSPEKRAEFEAEFSDLFGEEIELPGRKVDARVLGEVRLLPAHAAALAWLINEGE